MTWAVPAAASFAFIGDAAAAEITGKVMDQEGNPVPNATIRLDPVPGEWDVTSAEDETGLDVTTRSRESGRYMLKTLRPGKYRLTCGGSSSREIYVGIGVLRENCRQ
jgi:protocatechuate 3,4-dioxygenase beta subunit